MLSRVVETLYWMARHIERAENIARLINVNNNLLLDLPKNVTPGWEPLIDIIGARPAFLEQHSEINERNALKFLVADSRSPSSIVNCISNARENARTVRDILPKEVWHAINALYLFTKENQQQGINKRDRAAFMEYIIQRCQAIYGALHGTMIHDAGFAFVQLGLLVERADMSSRIIDVRSQNLVDRQDPSFDNIQWISVLLSLSAYQMYRQECRIQVKREDVLGFLLKNNKFPRSIGYCLDQTANILATLPAPEKPTKAVKKAMKLINGASLNTLKQQELNAFIDDMQIEFANLHNSISRQYFLPVD